MKLKYPVASALALSTTILLTYCVATNTWQCKYNSWIGGSSLLAVERIKTTDPQSLAEKLKKAFGTSTIEFTHKIHNNWRTATGMTGYSDPFDYHGIMICSYQAQLIASNVNTPDEFEISINYNSIHGRSEAEQVRKRILEVAEN